MKTWMAIAVLLAAGLLSCHTAKKGTTKAGQKTLSTATDSVIRVGNGTAFDLTLVTNPSTGYSWHFEDSAFMEYARFVNTTTQNTGNASMVGAPSLVTYHFTAVKPGTTHIALLYYRTWEGATRASPFDIEVSDEHGVSVTEEAVALFHRLRVRVQGVLPAQKSAHQHQQGGTGEMKIGDQRVHQLEGKPRLDEQGA
ncbi:MAG: hypothetical protein EBZ77_05245 [Chitinophagia bacterium]|nr:hypothetical protein [Chitinophagia bacterium]